MTEHPELVANYEDLRLLERPAGYVYVIRDVEISGCYKIGHTGHPLKRFDRFERELPFSIEPVLIIKSQDAEGDEERLHRDYAKYKEYGEWFKLNDSHLARIRHMSQPSIVLEARAPHSRPKKAEKSLRELSSIPRSEYEDWDKKEGSSYIYVIQEKETRLLRICWADEPEKINWFGVKIPIWTEVVIAEQVAGSSVILAGDLNRQFKQHRRVGNWLDLNDKELLELRNLIASREAPEQEPSAVQPPAPRPTPQPVPVSPRPLSVRATSTPRSPPAPRPSITLGDLLTQDKSVPVRQNQRPVQPIQRRQPQVATKRVFGWKSVFIFFVILIVPIIAVLLVPGSLNIDMLSNIFIDLQTPTPTQRPTAANTQRPTVTDTQHPTATNTQHPTATNTQRPTVTNTQRPTVTNTQRSTATNTQHPTATNTQRPTATPTPRPTITAATRETYTVRSANPYVRSCPSANCPFIGGLIAGDKIQSLGEEPGTIPEGFSSDKWIKFNYDGKAGYIHSQLVSKDDPADD